VAGIGQGDVKAVLPEIRDYDALRRAFRWNIPERFNIADAVSECWVRDDPGRAAMIVVQPDGSRQTLSHVELAKMANRIGNVFKAHGVTRGDRIALLLPQTPHTAAAHIAAYKLGAIVVPLAMLFGPDALSYRLENSGARALLLTGESVEKVAGIREGLPELGLVLSLEGAAEGVLGLDEEMAKVSDELEVTVTEPDDPALMIYTSGTTGPPKGALHAHRVLLGHLPGIQFAHEFFPQPGDMMWTPSDWAWAGGLLNVLLPSLYFGVPVVARKFDKFEPLAAWELICDLGIRNVFIPPTALKMMRGAVPADLHERLALRTIFSGGESVGRQLQEWAVETLGMPINEVYGQTECNLVLESCAAIDVWKPGAIGKPVPGHEVAVIDGSGKVLPQGEAGTIAVKRPDPVMFLEYWMNPEATKAKFVGDWMLTGDQGIMDEEGYFSFFGRDDDVITSAGYRIGPGEIEDCLIAHPAVKLAAVVGKPDPERTEIVKAFVVLNDGFEASDTLRDEIVQHVRTRLSAHEYPREISFEDSLPLTTTGKVIRRLLRERT
jgi:acetyl-CoA synthetase